MKKIFKMMVAMLVLVGLFSQNVFAATTINKEEKVVIGFDETFVPFGFKDDKGEFVGFDIDLAGKIFGEMGVEFEFLPIDWAMKETELNAGNIDMIWNGYSITPERQEIVQFSLPYLKNRQVIIVKADSAINTKADLAGMTIATQEQSASLEAILADEAFMKEVGSEPVTYPTFVEVFSDLDNGRADAIVVDETLATYFLTEKGDTEKYRFLEENFGEEEYGVGFRKDDAEFVKEFDEILKKLIDDGTVDDIKAKWFAEVKE